MTDTDPAVTRLFGGPGSGKTTALLDRVEDLLDRDDVDVRDVLVVSYTRAAAAEVRERLAERLEMNPRALRGNVSTMHAKAYDLLDLSRGDVVGESDKEEFCEDYGLPYEDEYASGSRRTARSTTLGNKIVATSQWLQRTQREVADWYDVPFRWNDEEVRLPPDIDENAQTGNKYTPTWPTSDDRVDVPEAIRAWRAYKGDEGLVGFADMLERVQGRSLVPSVDHLVIDEFQDITQLQYAVYEEWKPHMETAFIAGDDDQVVYAWQGADPKLLLEEDADEDVILENSYRLPSRVLDVVQREVGHIDERQEKDLLPRTEGGAVEAVASPSVLDLVRNVRRTIQSSTDDTVMVLFRARYQLFEFVDEFIDEGIPFRALTDQRLWTDRLTQYVSAVETLDREEPITGLQTRRLVDMLQSSAFGTNDRSEFRDLLEDREEAAGEDADLTEIEIDPETVREYVPFVPAPASAADMLRKVTRYQRRSVDAYVQGEYRDEDPGRVRVGTIHSAKGREADHVFLATDLTEKVVEQMAATVDPADVPAGVEFTRQTSPVPLLTDNERRVFYVGMSRARQRLVLLQNLVDGAPTLPIDVLLYGEPTGKTLEESLEGEDAVTIV
ncbi:MAG: UvrD-helicase domain-containing protein [Halanaeroarchaeum sp.]